MWAWRAALAPILLAGWAAAANPPAAQPPPQDAATPPTAETSLVRVSVASAPTSNAGLSSPRGNRVYPTVPYDDDDEPCPTDEEASSLPVDEDSPASPDGAPCPGPEECPPGLGEEDCGGLGMPVWHVSEPFLNLWVKDIPLYYTMSNGRILPLIVRYKQRGSPPSTNVFGFGHSWECSWLSYFRTESDGMLSFRVPGGGKRLYGSAGAETYRGFRCERVGAALGADGSVNYQIDYRSFCVNRYAQSFRASDGTPLQLLTEKRDPHGRRLQFHYATNQNQVLLVKVTDYDNQEVTLAYTNRLFPRFVTSVCDPYGRQAHFHYDTNGYLVRIVDMAGLTNAFTYDRDGQLVSMVTPYGTTRFKSIATDSGDPALPVYRSLLVTQPNGEREGYAYHESLASDCVPDFDTDAPRFDEEVPEPVTSGPLNQRSTFHWSARALATITNTWPSLAPAHYRLARWRHWDRGFKRSGLALGRRLLFERQPSPDGVTLGHRTWFAYFTDPVEYVPTVWPSLRTERLPDGSARYTQWERNEWGLPTAVHRSYAESGQRSVRSVLFGYDATDRNLTEVWGPDPTQLSWVTPLRFYSYNVNHQVTNTTDALGQVTTYSYHPSNRAMTGIGYPNGLVLTNAFQSGWLVRRTWLAPGSVPLATNLFQWKQGKVQAVTDARGFTVTQYWDPLGRLTGRSYPDGTTTSNLFVKLDGQPFPESTGSLLLLDRTRTKDRLGRWTSRTFNAARQCVALTNALGHVTRFAWCDCGSLGSVTDPLGSSRRFEYDLQGRLVATGGSGMPTRRIDWDLLGRPTSITDGTGWVQLRYNHQDLCIEFTTSEGYRASAEFDRLDRLIQTSQSPGISHSLTYDSLGRLLERREYPGGTRETWSYSPGLFGPTAYADPTGTNRVLISYDALGRVVAFTRGGGREGDLIGAATNRFTYNAAGDLLSWQDPLNRITRWTYSPEGRLLSKTNPLGQVSWTNAFDPNGQLIAHWTPARSNLTRYLYDPLGQLIRVDASGGDADDVQFDYDAAGRLIQMRDALGSTRFAWTPARALAAEDGPWPDDTVTFAYATDHRLDRWGVEQPNNLPWEQRHRYDTAGRLTQVESPAGTFAYSYVGGTPWVQGIALPNGAAVRNQFDSLGHLVSTALLNATGAVVNLHRYEYRAGSVRSRQHTQSGQQTDFAYDALGQLSQALGFEPSRAARGHEQETFAYNLAGNLIRRTVGGTTVNLAVNALNQLIAFTRSSTVTVSGTTTAAATAVRVNGQTATLYSDRTFAVPNLPAPSGSQTITAIAEDAIGRRATNTVQVNLPTSGSLTYDANGNLLGDANRRFAYNDRDQLISVLVTNGMGEASFTEFAYDGLGRKRVERERVWRGDRWVLASELRYLYAGMLAVQERDEQNLPVRTYTRGLDLRGSWQRGGGIGGLLAVQWHTAAPPATSFYHADAGGNVTALMSDRQQMAARYQYDPFGRLTAATGPLADLNRYRFSSKEVHLPSGLVDFGRRYYEPALQRWITPDPLEENAGPNRYQFVQNNPTAFIDPFGLDLHPFPDADWPWLPGPEPYVYGDSWFDRTVLAPTYNLSTTARNAAYWVGYAAVGAAEAFGGFVGYVEDLVGAPGLTEALPLGLALPRAGRALRPKCSGPREVFRYVGDGEARAASKAGCIPNLDAAGNPRFVYVTPEPPVKTAREAERIYRIGSLNPQKPTAPPTHVITADATSVDFIGGGNVEGGTGIELITTYPLPVIKIEPLPLK